MNWLRLNVYIISVGADCDGLKATVFSSPTRFHSHTHTQLERVTIETKRENTNPRNFSD